MNAVFADTFYFIAIINPKDTAHQAAVEFSKNFRASIVTTVWVLTELPDGLSKSPDRDLFRAVLEDFEKGTRDLLVWPDKALFRRGVELYDTRPDKDWSLTDCISFVVMQEQGITEALTGDHHFEQAGFAVLLK